MLNFAPCSHLAGLSRLRSFQSVATIALQIHGMEMGKHRAKMDVTRETADCESCPALSRSHRDVFPQPAPVTASVWGWGECITHQVADVHQAGKRTDRIEDKQSEWPKKGIPSPGQNWCNTPKRRTRQRHWWRRKSKLPPNFQQNFSPSK